ncbi:hypothetical protein [Marimonas arenosa]|uniref:Uncharacterized protein n=1 Tax=Marimonas arenosa TaxID=1795305 RepID=A0AAE3WDF2_9RHOB|nr:hypothetical protein [Marimonas arenosa]MDQ2089747.1 hypothetical protein [Marimonas arenosa]
MKIVELKTGLFPDAGTVEAALAHLRGDQEVERKDLTGLTLESKDAWDDVAGAILAADLVVTL